MSAPARRRGPTLARTYLELVSAPTVWEEGRMPGRRVTRLAALSCALLIGLDLLVTGGLSPVFDVGFVLVCFGSALAVRPRDFFRVGVMPPFLMLGLVTVLAVAHPVAVANADDGPVQAVISGLAHHAGALFAADVLALVVLAVRHRVARVRRDQLAPHEASHAAAPETGTYSNLETSPRPARVTSGTPEEKSTTVVGSEAVSPQSRTASNH